MHQVLGTQTPGLWMGGWGLLGGPAADSVSYGLKQVRISSGIRILRIVSDICPTYGRTTVALACSQCQVFWLVDLDWPLMNWARYPLLLKQVCTRFSLLSLIYVTHMCPEVYIGQIGHTLEHCLKDHKRARESLSQTYNSLIYSTSFSCTSDFN